MKDTDKLDIFYDRLTGRYFKYRYNSLPVIIKILLETFDKQDLLLVNDFYRLLGLPNTILGGMSGWTKKEDIKITIVEGRAFSDSKCYIMDIKAGRIEVGNRE